MFLFLLYIISLYYILLVIIDKFLSKVSVAFIFEKQEIGNRTAIKNVQMSKKRKKNFVCSDRFTADRRGVENFLHFFLIRNRQISLSSNNLRASAVMFLKKKKGVCFSRKVIQLKIKLSKFLMTFRIAYLYLYLLSKILSVVREIGNHSRPKSIILLNIQFNLQVSISMCVLCAMWRVGSGVWGQLPLPLGRVFVLCKSVQIKILQI